MTYPNRAAAQAAADVANRVYNYGPYVSRPVLTDRGWIVITSGSYT